MEREAIAYIHGGQHSYGFVGLQYANANGNKETIDSVNPATGVSGSNGAVVSDGNIDLGNSDVLGDAHAGPGQTLTQGSNSNVTGWTANLTDPITYPAPKIPTNVTI
jgi:hypothetical protein